MAKRNFISMNLFIFIFLYLLSLSLSQDVSCVEQWTEIDTTLEKWSKIGNIEMSSSSEGYPIVTFGLSTSAVWHSFDYSQNRGIHISFKPELSLGESASYPNGFALVFTSSSTKNLLGKENSGLGYDDIINGIAFEFNLKSASPYFSISHNINGILSSNPEETRDNSFNVELPNFYDESKENYNKDIIFDIIIIGKKIKLISKINGNENVLINSVFPEFQQLLEKGGVSMGFTYPGNEVDKALIIKNIKVEEIFMNKKGFLEIENFVLDENNIPNVKAGESITLNFYIKSLCDERLRIYLDEINVNDFNLRINEEEIKPESISFDDNAIKIKIIFSLNKANLYTAIVHFKGFDSYPIEFIVVPNSSSRPELCEHGTGDDKYYATSIYDENKEYFYISLCLYDHLGNIKVMNNNDLQGIKIKYPLNIIFDETVEYKEDKINKRIMLKIYFSNFGVYEIFSENFIEEKMRYIKLMPKYISPDKSEISILYGQNIIQSDTTKINLRIKPKDTYNRNIPIVIMQQINCDFSQSEITKESNIQSLPITAQYKDDYVILSVNKPEEEGKYIFMPKVKCDNIDLIELNCDIDSITKINNCEFYYSIGNLNENLIQVYDEVSDEFITYKKDTANTNYLYFSLDEKNNQKLTEINLLDENESKLISNTDHTITATLDDENLSVVKVGTKYNIKLPESKTRENYTPIKSYNLKIVLNNASTFIIPIKFFFIDKYMTNADVIQKDTSKISYIAFYKQNSYTLEAGETFLLFEIYELSENKYIGNANTLDESKVSLEINSEVTTTNIDIINHNNFFISVIIHGLTMVDDYNIKLKYDNAEISNINIKIIPKSEAYFLADEEGTILDESEEIEIDEGDLKKLKMMDKYENIINTNKIFNAFAKIKISDNNIFQISINYDASIHILNTGIISDKFITLTLINGKVYKIKSVYSPNFDNNLSPLISYGLFANDNPIIDNDKSIELNLFLKDKYGNSITGAFDKDNINIYIEGNNLIEIVKLTTSQTSIGSDGKINYKGSLVKTGDFVIKIFINNFPIECKGCHFNKNYVLNEDYNQASINILGNKQKIEILNSYSLSRKRVAFINKNNYFHFYLDIRDKNLNLIKQENTITLNFESEDSSVDVSSITICPKENGFYELCENVHDSWSELPDGIYLITNEDLKYKFYLYLSNGELDSSNTTPVRENSMLWARDFKLYGKLDIPGQVILDIRNSEYKRIKGLDKSKITIYFNKLSNINIKVTPGPEEGLFTIFFLAQLPRTYTFNIRYDGKDVIYERVNYVCTCGNDIILKPGGSDFSVNGNYAFFKLIDSNDNDCSSPILYNWNPLNEKNFANFALKAQKDENIYKTETYYNHVTNTLIIYLENYVTEYVNFYSDIYKFYYDEDYITMDLIENIIDENHFYASINDEKNKLTITALNANYEPAFNCILENTDIYFTVSLIRIVNDDFIIIKSDYIIEDDFCEFYFELDNTLLDAKGKYLYVVYYQGKEIFCENCLINNAVNDIDISKTKVFNKEGDFNYYQNDGNNILPMFKTNIPFFRINIFSSNDNLIILDQQNSEITIDLKTESNNESIDIGTKYSTNGNIYIYLTQEGRSKYWSLNSMEKIVLSIKYSDNSFDALYYVMDHSVKNLNNYLNENCDKTKEPLLINKQNIYIKRYDEDLELEIRLSNCLKDSFEKLNKIKIYEEENNENYYEAEVIPTDILGGYFLFFPNNINIKEKNKFYIINNNDIKSDIFTVHIIPGYDIKKIEFSKDENMDESGGDKVYTFFMIQMKDKYDNIITNEGRNLFINDIYAFKINNIPYRLSYDDNKKSFRCQVPIFIKAELKATSLISDDEFNIEIEQVPKVYKKSLVTLESENNNEFIFKFELKDEVYNDVSSDEYINDVSFKYITINPITETVFILDGINAVYKGDNKFSITLNKSVPKYTIYGFIPYLQFFPQVCPSCIKKNLYPDFIYTFNAKKYEPHFIDSSKNLYLSKNKDIPSFLYWSHNDITIESNEVTVYELFNNDNTKVNVMYFDNVDDDISNINIAFTKDDEEKIEFNAELIDYSEITEYNDNNIKYAQIFGNNLYTPNLGDKNNINIDFFIDIRDSSGKLISNLNELYIDENYESYIDNIEVFNTELKGIYYIVINFAKSGNFEYFFKFSQSQIKSENDEIIYINSIPSFPTYISLEDKEIINKNNIKYIIKAHNDVNELICDQRLNLYMENMNLKSSHITIANYDNKCELYIIFSGYAIIKSSINNYTTQISHNDKSLYNISPQFSTLSITPNAFSSNEETLLLKFIEKSNMKNIYENNEFNSVKSIFVYNYITPYKIKLIKTYNNLLSNEYNFNGKNLEFELGEIYILIGNVVNSTISPIFAYYQKESSNENSYEINSINNIETIFFDEDKKYNVITNFNKEKIFTGDSLYLTLPFLLRVKFLDDNNNDIIISSDDGKRLKSKLVLYNDNSEAKMSIDLIIRQYDDRYFFIQYDPCTISNIIHLPVYLANNNEKYFIEIEYDNTNNLFFSLLSLEQRNNLQIFSLNKRYNYPTNAASLASFKLIADLHEKNSLSIPQGKANINHICLLISENSEDVLYNEHLNMNLVTININTCSDYAVSNSYMGCFEISINCEKQDGMKLTFKYNGVDSSNEVSINIFDSSNVNFDLITTGSTTNIIYGQLDPVNLFFNTNADINSLSMDLFKIFSNGEKIESADISSTSDNDIFKFIIPSGNFNTIQKNKNLMILYEDGSDLQKLILNGEYSLTVAQKEYDNNAENYYFRIQDPLALKVGENIYFYLLIFDENKACYYGEFDKIKNIEITLTISAEEKYTINIKSRQQIIEGYYQCEYIYLVDFEKTAKKSGDFNINIKDGILEHNSKIHISSNDIEGANSYFSGETEVQAGHNIYINFNPKDTEGNSVNIYDLLNKIEIALIDSNGNEVESKEENYVYDIKVNSDSNELNIYLKINIYGDYSIKLKKDGTMMNLKSDYTISVVPLECSFFEPEIKLLPNDYRDEYYYGENINVEIKCKDIFGNYITTKGNEIFSAKIKLVNEENDDEIIYKFDQSDFSQGKHYITFSLDEPGIYNLDINLNGNKYGESLNFEIKSIDSTKYTCMNKNQVDNLADCDNDAYRNLLQEILGNEYICYTSNKKGYLYKCSSTDADCVIHTNECKCSEEYSWMGYCYVGGVSAFPLTTGTGSEKCLKDLSNVYMCGDGSCRYKESECLTKFECPLGYKPCGVSCILLNEICNDVNVVCNTNEVLCWDLSCAETYDSCPTRITCPNNKVLCPDNTCQLSGHCIQPKNRKCKDDEYQCPDFSCVINKNECIKNIVCEPGFSLCENKTCNKFCLDEERNDNDNDKDDDGNNAGLIAGLVCGIGGACIIGGGLFYFLYWRKRKIIDNENINLNTGNKNIDIISQKNNTQNVKIYNKKETDANNNHHDVDEIKEESVDVVKESTRALRSIKNNNN